MSRLQRPRLWVRLVSIAALVVAGWLLLVPRTALYFVDDKGRPYNVRVMYSWGTFDQIIMVPAIIVDPDRPDDVLTGVRLGCGTAFTSGQNEGNVPGDGAAACSEVEKPRRIIGLCLTALGVAGLLGALKLPRVRGPAES